MMKRNVRLAPFTTLGLGGPADYFIRVRSDKELAAAVRWAREKEILWLVIGSGSNLLVADRGFRGLIIKNEITGIKQFGQKLIVKGGNQLNDLVDFANRAGLAGLENLAGIPGTVGGAIYGNAGAYGQTIGDCLSQVTVFDGRGERTLRRSQCRFAYRSSLFQDRKGWVITGAEFHLRSGDPEALRAASKAIRATRSLKYPVGLKCPGSFFKNVVAARLPKEVLDRISPEKTTQGKIPAGYLLEEVGAKGRSRGAIRIADYHGNLFFNTGEGTARDFWNLAKTYQRKVRDKFGVLLEPEVQLVGFGFKEE